jgi:hypothetical protein
VPGAACPPQRPRGGGRRRRRPRVRGRLHFFSSFPTPSAAGSPAGRRSRGLGDYSSLFLWRCRDTGRFRWVRTRVCTY